MSIKDVSSGVRTLSTTNQNTGILSAAQQDMLSKAPAEMRPQLEAQMMMGKAQDLLKDLTAQVATVTKNTATAGTAANTAATGANATSNAALDEMFPPRSIKGIFDALVGSGPTTPSTPSTGDSSHPSGSLQTGANGVITTPGGYKIEATSQFEWKVTGPDGKSTRVWGDPHVDEGDGGKWDFKRDSTFVLGDGTRINCSTTDYGNGMTVTKGLEIISGNERVQISDIDKGKGKTGAVTQDGYAHVNSFGGKDVFVMGKETDDWSFGGKEVIGSNNGGESFKLGGALAAGTTQGGKANSNSNFFDKLSNLFGQMSKLFESLSKLSKQLENHNPFEPNRPRPGSPWLQNRQSQIKTSFEDIGRMMDRFNTLQNLNRSVNQNRFLTF